MGSKGGVGRFTLDFCLDSKALSRWADLGGLFSGFAGSVRCHSLAATLAVNR